MRKVYAIVAMTLLVGMLSGCPQPKLTELRVLHASPDAPAIDICLDGNKFVENLDYGEISVYKITAHGTRILRLVAAGDACYSTDAIERSINLARSADYSIVALDYVDDLDLVTFNDNNTAPEPGMSKVRFVHAIPNGPTVDVRTDDDELLFEDIAFKEGSGYIQVTPGTYNLQLNESITGLVPIVHINNVTFNSDRVITIFAIGILGGDPGIQLIITTDD